MTTDLILNEVQAMVEEGERDEVGMKVDANVVNAIIDKI